MSETFERIFGGGFMPHGHCYLWTPALVWLQVLSNAAIALAYLAISATIYYIIRRIRDIPFSWMYLAFGVFIVTCGATHALDVVTIWLPVYWLDGTLRAITAVASVGTAILLVPLVPRAVALASASRVAHERGLKLASTYEELAAAHEKTKELERAKTDFYANVSHELRTPLTLLLGPLQQMLLDPALDRGHRDKLEVAARNASLLLKHVNDLLDVAKIEAGRLAPRYVDGDLSHVVRLTGALFDSMAREKTFRFQVEAPETLPAQFDPDMLQRVVVNLLSNAVKHVPPGGSVRCIVESTGDRARIDVEDSGSGVPDELKSAVFERFRQAESGLDRAGGSGLGLAIVKELVELHRGDVHVEDAPGGGARFRVELPLRSPEGAAIHAARRDELHPAPPMVRPRASARESEPEPKPETTADRPTVLVIDDNSDMRRFVRGVLAPAFAVETAADGQEGFDKIQALHPDVVVSDMMMPRMTGEELVRAVRAREELADIPILVLSARADDALRVKLLREGANDYAVKPFEAEELLVRVGNLAAVRRARQVLKAELHSATGNVEALAREVAARNRALAETVAELRVAKARAEAATAMRQSFLNLVSHEMRTPLAALHIQLEMLRRGADPLSAKQRRYVEKMEALFQRIAEMMSSVLELVNLQSGDAEAALETEPVDAAELVQEVVEAYAPAARAKGLAVRIEIPPDLPHIRTERHLARVLLAQLVSNAVRHTEKGEVSVCVRAVDGTLRFEVIDTGPGITPERKALLFQPFEPHEDTAYKHTPGLGLGLALAKRVVERLNGTLQVVSEAGRGSTFATVLPGAMSEVAP